MMSFDIDAMIQQAYRDFNQTKSPEAKTSIIARLLAEIVNHKPKGLFADQMPTPWARLMDASANMMNRNNMCAETITLLRRHMAPSRGEGQPAGELAGSYSTQYLYMFALNSVGDYDSVISHMMNLMHPHAGLHAKFKADIIAQYNRALIGSGYPEVASRKLRPLVQKDGMFAHSEQCQIMFRTALETEADRHFASGHNRQGHACLKELLEHGLSLIQEDGPFAKKNSFVLPVLKLAKRLGRYSDIVSVLRPKVQPDGYYFDVALVQHMFVDALYNLGFKNEVVNHLSPLAQRNGAYYNSVFAHDFYSNALMDTERCETAICHLRPLVRPGGLLEKNPVMQVRFVKALLIRKQSDEAINHLLPLVSESSKLYRRHPMHYMLAKAYISNGQPHKAVEHLGPFMKSGGLFDGNEYCIRIMIEALKAAGRKSQVVPFVRAQEKRHRALTCIPYHLETVSEHVNDRPQAYRPHQSFACTHA